MNKQNKRSMVVGPTLGGTLCVVGPSTILVADTGDHSENLRIYRKMLKKHQ